MAIRILAEAFYTPPASRYNGGMARWQTRLASAIGMILSLSASAAPPDTQPAADSLSASQRQTLEALLGQIEALQGGVAAGKEPTADPASLLSKARHQAQVAADQFSRRAAALETLERALTTLKPNPEIVSIISPVTPASAVEFTRDIRPIFEARCYTCHGPEKSKSGLRLDRKADAFRGGEGGPVIIPGKSAESRLVSFVSGSKKDVIMPPTGERLAPEQVSLLRRWIDAGAPWPDDEVFRSKHWSYQKPVRPALPEVRNPTWPRNEIDRFILARLEAEGLPPSPEAGRERLIRRVTFDLTGLPPTLAEVDAFVADTSSNAYEKVVDRLLASPHYGERMARVWLDLARYADTNGYHVDRARIMWKYRDWVIDAFNRNVPYDEFTIEQLAGDLLPHATPEQKIASGFNRNTMFNEEGGVDPEEFRDKAVVDRVNTCMTVWMGSTFGCAQCHSHKYDPFTQKEFYQLYAFFNTTTETGGGTYASVEPKLELPTPQQQAQRDKLRGEIDRLEAERKASVPKVDAAQSQWEQQIAAAANPWIMAEPLVSISREGATLTRQADGSVLASGERPERDRYVVSLHTELTNITGVRLETLTDPSFLRNGPGRHNNSNFVLTGVTISVAPDNDPGAIRTVPIASAIADFSQADYPIRNVLDADRQTGWAISPQIGQPHAAVFEAKEPFGVAGGCTVTVSLDQQFGESATIGRFRLALTTSPRPLGVGAPPGPIVAIAGTPPEKRTPDQQKTIKEYYRAVSPEIQKTNEAIAGLKRQDEELTKGFITTLILKDLDKPRKTQVHVRGDFLNLAEEVQPATPAVFHPFPAGQPRSRLGLARWLVDPENPMVGRVTVNRLWEMFFGHGLVDTCEDFGTQGSPPTHPELLDWLATDFTRDWDVKRTLKQIVMTATYRQASSVSAALLDKDPYNKLYARGPRFRMDAETIRDNALAVSGLISLKIGGPSVFPYQPAGLWEEKGLNTFDNSKWVTSKGDDLYRRGLYTYIRRSVPYPTMLTFDGPTREYCCVRRPRTNTPLQALTTLNDPVYIEAARVFAQRIMREAGPDAAVRVSHAFRLCLARSPTATELDRLVQLYQRQAEHYTGDKTAAIALINNGEFPRPDKVDAGELAAWTVVANVLLNLDENVTKG